MAALDELLADLLPAARIVWPAGGLKPGMQAPAIGWVRVMKARVPAFDALEAGDLAIVPASALTLVAPDAGQARAIVELCRRAQVGALLMVDAEGPGAEDGRPAGSTDAFDALLEAIAAVGGPVAVRTPRADVVALERAVIGYLVNRRAELDRQAATLEAELEQLALSGAGPTAMIGAIAAFLGRAVALEDRRGVPLAVHAPPNLPESTAAVAAYHAPRGAGASSAGPRPAALRAPLPTPGGPVGSLVLLRDRAVGELDRTVAGRIAGLLALELTRDADVRQARDATRRPDTLPAAGPPWVVLLARQRPASGAAAAGAGTVDADPGSRAAREAVRRELRHLAPARRLVLRGDADSLELRLVLAADGGDADASELATRVADLLDRPVAVSRTFDAAHDRPTAEAEARATLEAVEALADPPRLAWAARLGAYRLLGGLTHVPDGTRHARALLEPLLAGRPDVRREHLETLRAVLGHASTAEAAARLGVHRNTVAYRVRRIENLTSWRLDDPDLRVALAVALRLVHID